MKENLPRCEPFKVYKGGGFLERLAEFKSHQMGLQVPRGVDTEVQKEDSVRRDEETVGTGVEETGKSEGEPNTGKDNS